MILAAMVAGCAAQAVWLHPTATQAKFDQDKLQCEYEVSSATAAIRSGFEAGWRQAELQDKCMRARGYYRQ